MGETAIVAVILIGVAIMLINSSGGGSGDASSGGGGPLSSGSPKIMLLASAIAAAEGFGIDGAIPTRANNPGDLVLGDIGYGTLGAGITVYATPADGWNALYKELDLILTNRSGVYSSSMTFAQIAAHWTQTQVSQWAHNVASYVGAGVDTPLVAWLNS